MFVRLRRMSLMLLAGVLLVGLFPATTFAGTTVTTYSADFEGGVLPDGWTIDLQNMGPNSSGYSSLCTDASFAHGGTGSLLQGFTPDSQGPSYAYLQVFPRQDGFKYEMDGWVYVQENYNYAMTTSAFAMFRGTQGIGGVEFSPNCGGTLGYVVLCGGQRIYGQNIQPGTWQHVTLTYDVNAHTVRCTRDGTTYGEVPVLAVGPPEVIRFGGFGGWWPGNAMKQYIDDVTVTVWSEDTVPPTVTAPSDVTLRATSAGGVSHDFEATASDNVGVASLKYFIGDTEITSPHTFPVGETTVNCVAKDDAGNTSTAAFKVTVLSPYAPSGFLPPINADGGSIFQLGRTIPVKLTLNYYNGGPVAGAVIKVYLTKLSDVVTGDEFEAASTSAADTGNTMRDLGAGSYIYNLSTANLTTGTYRLRAVYPDDTSSSVNFSLR